MPNLPWDPVFIFWTINYIRNYEWSWNETIPSQAQNWKTRSVPDGLRRRLSGISQPFGDIAMPCFSTIQTVLIDLAALQKAADNLGMQLIKRNADTYTLSKGAVSAYLQRSGEGQKFTASNASYNFNSEVLRPISQEYAKVRIKEFAKKKGYTVSAGSKPGEVILTQY